MGDKEVKSGRLRPLDLFIIIIFLSIAVVSVELFRRDLLQTFNLQNVEPVGTVIVKKNTVQRRLGDRVVWDRLAHESPVYIGDIIRVADASLASLHIGAANLDLDEHTLIRIILSPDGESIQIVLNEGSLSLVTSAQSSPVILEVSGNQIVTGPGSMVNAELSDTGQMSVQVTGEPVVLINNRGETREIHSGNMIAMEANGTELHESAVVVSFPLPNMRFLNNSRDLFPVNFSWNRINIEPGKLLRLEISANRNFSQVSHVRENLHNSAQVNLDNGIWFWRIFLEGRTLGTGSITIADGTGPHLVNPAVNSIFRYSDELPVLNYQWREIDEAVSYVLEISSAPDFSNPRIRRQSSVASLSDSSLGEGLWYWRVMPVFPSVFNGYTAFSAPSFFRITQVPSDTFVSRETISLLQWLQEEAPSNVVPPEIPQELIPVYLQQTEPEPELSPEPELPAPVPAPRPPAPAPRQPPVLRPPSLLAAPRNLIPASGVNFNHEHLQSERTIVFNWAAVQGANAYIFTLYHRTSDGMRQIIRATINRSTSYTVDNFRLLDRGTFVWQVEPVSMGRGNVIERHGNVSENIFNIEFESPRPVQIEDIGILYGN